MIKAEKARAAQVAPLSLSSLTGLVLMTETFYPPLKQVGYFRYVPDGTAGAGFQLSLRRALMALVMHSMLVLDRMLGQFSNIFE